MCPAPRVADAEECLNASTSKFAQLQPEGQGRSQAHEGAKAASTACPKSRVASIAGKDIVFTFASLLLSSPLPRLLLERCHATKDGP